MKSKKWIFNMLLSVSLLTLLTMLCGFSGEGLSCNNEHYLDYTLGVGDGYNYPSYESGDGANQTLTMYVPLNQETQIPLKAVLTPTEGFTLQDFGGQGSGWSFVADSGMPNGLILGTSDVQEINGSLVVTTTVAVSNQANHKIFDPVTIRLTNQASVSLSADSIQLKITAMDTSCALCGGLVQQDGTYAHKACGLCGGLCNGTAYVHKTCNVCGSSCDGTAYAHKTCNVCGGLCDGISYAHKACDVCGGLCDGISYVHKACDVCGGLCNGTAYAHKTCDVCGGLCDGISYAHKACDVCGGLCDGISYAHKTCSVCGGLCDGTAYAHKTCKTCGVICDGTGYTHKAGFSCSGESGETSSDITTTEGQTANVTTTNTSNQTEGDKAVATGDTTPIMLYSVLALVSGIMIALSILLKKKYLKIKN